MAIISEVKCSRCDRRYSGLRSRCPYCGARRSKRGKMSRGEDNSKGKIIIALLLMLIVVVAVVVLIVSSVRDNNPVIESAPPSGTAGLPHEPSIDVASTTPPPGVSDLQSPQLPTSVVQSVKIINPYGGGVAADISLEIGERVELVCEVVPNDTGLTPIWESSDPDKFSVLPSGRVTGISKCKEGTLTVTVGDKTATCIVRVS